MDNKRELIFVCSPLSGDIDVNIEKAKEYSRYVVLMGNIPFTPHLLYTQFLDDTQPSQRELAVSMGINMLKRCDELWVFGNRVSGGMAYEIATAEKIGIEVKYIGTKLENLPVHDSTWNCGHCKSEDIDPSNCPYCNG